MTWFRRSRRRRSGERLILVRLSKEQIARAKEANGPRKRITHALLCGHYGQIFGTDKQCRKYYDAWKTIFPTLFSSHLETDDCEIAKYHSTFNLVSKLIEAEEGKN